MPGQRPIRAARVRVEFVADSGTRSALAHEGVAEDDAGKQGNHQSEKQHHTTRRYRGTPLPTTGVADLQVARSSTSVSDSFVPSASSASNRRSPSECRNSSTILS